MSDKKNERRDAMKNRFSNRGESKADASSSSDSSSSSNETSSSSKTDSTESTSGSSKADNSSSSSKPSKSGVREKQGVTMYLDPELVEDLDFRFDELNLHYRREHGEKMQKNTEFYPAMVRAAINNTTIEDELELKD